VQDAGASLAVSNCFSEIVAETFAFFIFDMSKHVRLILKATSAYKVNKRIVYEHLIMEKQELISHSVPTVSTVAFKLAFIKITCLVYIPVAPHGH